MSRREFVRGAATAGAAVAGLSLVRSAHAAGNDALRVGLIGCGSRGIGAAANAMEADAGVRLAALADLFADRAEDARSHLKDRWPEQVTATRDDCFAGLDAYRRVIEASDVVLIANAAKFHPLQLSAAIEAGKHVFIEKPHAIDPAGIQEAARALDLAREKGLGVLSGLQSRFQADIQETIQRIHDGQIGDIVAIDERWLRAPYFGATLKHRPEGMREIEIQYGSQYRFAWLCGDDVTQTLVHNLDRAAWALGDRPPVRCYGMGGRSGEPLFGDVFDHHAVVYEYASGVRVYAKCRTTQDCYDENASVIMGTKGAAYVREGRITGENPWEFSGEVPDPYRAEHRAFFQSIRDGEPLHCGDYMTRGTLMSIMGQLSCYSGQEITWDEAAQSDYCLGPAVEACNWDMAPPTEPDPNGVYPVPAVPGVADGVWPIAYGRGAK